MFVQAVEGYTAPVAYMKALAVKFSTVVAYSILSKEQRVCFMRNRESFFNFSKMWDESNSGQLVFDL
jgi:hypothetical protein